VNRAQQFHEQIEAHKLPGRGMTVLLRRPDISALIMANAEGDVPAALTQQLLDSLKPGSRRKNGKATTGWDIGAEDLPQVNRFMNLIIRATLISPRISDTPNYDEDEIEIGDLVAQEREYIFSYGFQQAREVAAAAQFPAGQVAGVDAVADGTGIPHEAEPVAGDG